MSNTSEDYLSLLSFLDYKDDVTRCTNWPRILAASPELQAAWTLYRHAQRVFDIERRCFRDALEELAEKTSSKDSPA